jgi:hypothetical protein
MLLEIIDLPLIILGLFFLAYQSKNNPESFKNWSGMKYFLPPEYQDTLIKINLYWLVFLGILFSVIFCVKLLQMLII